MAVYALFGVAAVALFYACWSAGSTPPPWCTCRHLGWPPRKLIARSTKAEKPDGVNLRASDRSPSSVTSWARPKGQYNGIVEKVNMADVLNLYVDDSGSRLPDRKVGHNSSRWFGLGGVLINERDEGRARQMYAAFRQGWEGKLLGRHLHSNEIRQKQGPFSWIVSEPDDGAAFIGDLNRLLVDAPLLCTACVINRAGYASRYFEKYDEAQRWQLCKTAFSVLLERTVKFAVQRGQVVRVLVERTDKVTDRCMRQYYDALRTSGMPFNPGSMALHQPLGAEVFRERLYEFRTKKKTSPMMQLADLCLYPLCIAGFRTDGRDYQSLKANRKRVNDVLAPGDTSTLGIKYSCFDDPKAAADLDP
jgi:hypothetical protein